jgi:thioredoxin 1
MNRRTLILTSLAAALTLPLPLVAGTPYSPDLVAKELKAGRLVLLDFTASWCSSCRAQGRAITALRAENPAYDDTITFVDVDWDTYQNTDLARAYGITGRGALVLLRGDQVVTVTRSHSTKDQIKAMLDGALS